MALMSFYYGDEDEDYLESLREKEADRIHGLVGDDPEDIDLLLEQEDFERSIPTIAELNA